MRRKKILIIFGTRPEAIKLSPLIIKLKKFDKIVETKICITAQHREMLDQILNLFEINPDYDLNIMTNNQTLGMLTSKILIKVSEILVKIKPDIIVVQGDTTTTFASALSAFYLKIPIYHIEAGLRTYNKYNPFPEEINRTFVSLIANYHFAPTNDAKFNLINVGINKENIFVTGNTVIDSLLMIVKQLESKGRKEILIKYFIDNYNLNLNNKSKNILITGHRRENFGKGFEQICIAIKNLALMNSDIKFIYPVHLNPNVQKPVYQYLNNITNIFLTPPLDYEPFVFLLSKSYLILTDSGGIQEEAPSLKIPVLVMRNTTERPEGISAGCSKLIGISAENIVNETQILLNNNIEYKKMTKTINPYGDGKSSEKIIEIILNSL